jgi:hypothetical protein
MAKAKRPIQNSGDIVIVEVTVYYGRLSLICGKESKDKKGNHEGNP